MIDERNIARNFHIVAERNQFRIRGKFTGLKEEVASYVMKQFTMFHDISGAHSRSRQHHKIQFSEEGFESLSVTLHNRFELILS